MQKRRKTLDELPLPVLMNEMNKGVTVSNEMYSFWAAQNCFRKHGKDCMRLCWKRKCNF